MDPNTGAIIEGDEEDLKQLEQDLKRKLIPLGPTQAETLRSATADERRAVCKRVQKNRDRRKRAKKSKRKNR